MTKLQGTIKKLNEEKSAAVPIATVDRKPAKMFKAFNNFIVFKTNKLFHDKVKFGGEGGTELSFDPTFEPAKNCVIFGEVVSLPVRLTKIPIVQQHKGLPSYKEESPYLYRYLRDIEQEVKVGDRIYFHFNTIKPHNIIRVDGVHPDRTWFLKVQYGQVFCAVRNGVIIPIGGYTLIDPDWESWDDISIPIPQIGADGKPMTNPDGSAMMKPKEQWLVQKSVPGYKYLKGFVRHVGSPLKGEKCEVKVGQRIWYTRNADFMIRVEDRDYFCIHQRHIIGREE